VRTFSGVFTFVPVFDNMPPLTNTGKSTGVTSTIAAPARKSAAIACDAGQAATRSNSDNGQTSGDGDNRGTADDGNFTAASKTRPTMANPTIRKAIRRDVAKDEAVIRQRDIRWSSREKTAA
jgi:hypothetical protein